VLRDDLAEIARAVIAFSVIGLNCTAMMGAHGEPPNMKPSVTLASVRVYQSVRLFTAAPATGAFQM
jgi:hypothetical protein